MDFMKLYWKRRAANVRRFHTEDWVGRDQTVGHHSYNMAVMLLEILGLEHCTKELLTAVLYHDMAEKFTGDIPAPAKWSGGFSTNLDVLEKRVRASMGAADPTALSGHSRCLLKAADTLECILEVLDQCVLGNQTAGAIFHRLEKHVAKSKVFDIHPGFQEAFKRAQEAFNEIVPNEGSFLQSIRTTYHWESPEAVLPARSTRDDIQPFFSPPAED